MNFEFDLKPFEAKCFISDKTWEMIISSGSFMTIGRTNYAVYGGHVLTFVIRPNGLVELLNRFRKPCPDYELPVVTKEHSYSQRVAAYMEQEKLQRGMTDSTCFLVYGSNRRKPDLYSGK